MEQIPNSSRRLFTAEERAKYVELFQQSGMTQQAFAEQHGFHAVTLRQWLRRSKEKNGAGANGQVKFQEYPLPAPTPGWAAEIVLGQGVSVRLGARAATELLEQLVNRLSQAC